LIRRGYVEGAFLKKGDLLFEIDPRPFEAALAKAKANLENARATQIKTLTPPPFSLANPRQGKLAPVTEPKLVLEWQDGLATELGFRQQKLRLSFARRPWVPLEQLVRQHR